MDLENKRTQMNDEMTKFIVMLNDVLPYYASLLERNNLSQKELSELGDLEYFLIELNGKIAEIKRMLDHDLFGLSIDSYYKTKEKALAGDFAAKQKLDTMRDSFNESLKSEAFISWN